MPDVVSPPIRQRIRTLVERAWATAEANGDVPALVGGTDRPAIEVAHPAKPEHGDVALNLAMKLARPLRRPPLELAMVLAAAIGAAGDDVVEAVEVAPPGFINIRLAPGFVAAELDVARAAGSAFGRLTAARP
ncbi:MAG TPA: hypothetical protein VIF84_09545, partial [Candidatus Limnocylindrales bacterium]